MTLASLLQVRRAVAGYSAYGWRRADTTQEALFDPR